MWKRGGRSSALDRAEALLSAKRSSTGASESTQRSTDTTREHAGAVDKFIRTRSASPKPHILLSDLSDLSSVSSSPENEANTLVSENIQAVRLQSSMEGEVGVGQGGRRRFLKKVPPPSTSSSQSPERKNQRHPMSEPRYVSSSQRSSQTAVISRLAEIESRFHRRQQNQEQVRRGIPSPSPEAERRPVSSQSSSEQSLKGKRFLKTKAAVSADKTRATVSGSPQGPGPGVGFRSRAAGATLSSVGLVKSSVRVVSGVSLESDEEDMKKLLGDSVDSTDRSLFGPGRTANKEIKLRSPPAAVNPSPSSDPAPPRSPVSPSSHSSPFRFTGHVRAQFSPSALSPSPSPPHVSPSPTRRQKSPPSLQRSLSSTSGHEEVLSLEELFPTGRHSEDPHSDMSSVSSEDFKMNVMTIDDLVPAAFAVTEESPRKEKEVKHSSPVPESQQRYHELPRMRVEKEKVEEDEVMDYQSDFESEIRTEMDNSTGNVSEYLQEDETEVVSEVRKEAWSSDASSKRMRNVYSSSFSDTDSQTSGCSQTSELFSSSRSTSSSHNSRTSHYQRRRSTSLEKKNVKDVAVQTQPDTVAYSWLTGTATFNPPSATTFMTYTPLAAYTLSAERVEALSTFSPAVFALNEMLKQQLIMTRRFIESSQRIHSSLVQSLEPPNYKYTTLEDTKEIIRKRRPPKLTMEEALEKVQQEMRENCT